MIENLFAKIGAILLAPIMAITGFFLPDPVVEPNVGTALPQAVAVFETSLAAPITAAATTMTLTANSIRGGGSLSGFNCFTVDEGSAQAEFICGDVATTTVTNLQRGISPADGITEDTDLQFSHRRGANVKITDFPIVQRLKLQNNGDGTFENAISYAAGVIPTGNNHLTDVEYVLSVVNGGTVSFDQEIITGNAGETVATGTVVYLSPTDGEWYKADTDVAGSFTDRLIGITQGNGTNGNAVTGGILISGVDSNQTGLTANSLYFLSNTAGGVQTATSSQLIGIAKSTTELILVPHILDTYNGYSTTYAGNNTFSGSTTTISSATTTFTGDFVDFAGINDIRGHASTTYTVYTASTTWSKPDGLEYIEVWVCAGGGGGATVSDGSPDDAGGGGGGGACSYEELTAAELSATTSVAVVVGLGGIAEATGGTSSFGNFLSATGGVGATAAPGTSGGTATGGDLNIDGGDGDYANQSDSSSASGRGGDSVFGRGGGAVSGDDIVGRAGKGYGGGGSGGRGDAGGIATQGFVSIKVYF